MQVNWLGETVQVKITWGFEGVHAQSRSEHEATQAMIV